MKTDYDGPLIVGFGHRRRMGKDTLAWFVHRHLHMSVNTSAAVVPFARQLKVTAYKLFRCVGLQDHEWYDTHSEMREIPLPELGKSPRDLWIEIGNKLRDVDPDIWIRNALDAHPRPEADVVLIPDVRYPNEFKAIRDRGGVVVKVLRPGTPESSDVADSALAGMKTGAWDRVILNDGDIDALDRKAGFLTQWIVRRLAARNAAAE